MIFFTMILCIRSLVSRTPDYVQVGVIVGSVIGRRFVARQTATVGSRGGADASIAGAREA